MKPYDIRLVGKLKPCYLYPENDWYFADYSPIDVHVDDVFYDTNTEVKIITIHSGYKGTPNFPDMSRGWKYLCRLEIIKGSLDSLPESEEWDVNPNAIELKKDYQI